MGGEDNGGFIFIVAFLYSGLVGWPRRFLCIHGEWGVHKFYVCRVGRRATSVVCQNGRTTDIE